MPTTKLAGIQIHKYSHTQTERCTHSYGQQTIIFLLQIWAPLGAKRTHVTVFVSHANITMNTSNIPLTYEGITTCDANSQPRISGSFCSIKSMTALLNRNRDVLFYFHRLPIYPLTGGMTCFFIGSH